MQTITALDFRKKFGETLDLVQLKKQIILVERQNIPVGVFYPYEQKQRDVEKEEATKKSEKIINGFRSLSAKIGKTGAEDSTKLIRKMRDNRYGKTYFKKHSHY